MSVAAIAHHRWLTRYGRKTGCIVAGLAALSLLGAALWAWEVSCPPHLPANLGNWPWIIRALESRPKDLPLSFAVVGDTRSFGTFEAILKRLHSLNLAFMVNLGDFSIEPTPWSHQYFLQEMANELKPEDPPVLMVPGNHDVNPSTFPIDAFERLYGPATFSFECADNLFVILGYVGARSPGRTARLAYLENVLSQRRKYVRRVFVLTHRPPVDPSQDRARIQKTRFMRLMERYRVDYVISGDLHRYSRIKVGPTVVLITGGGGAHLESGTQGAFHHAVQISVYEDRVAEDIIPVSRGVKFEEKVEYFFMTRLLPRIRRGLSISQPGTETIDRRLVMH